jgi:osmotically-inducible protein OsmY
MLLTRIASVALLLALVIMGCGRGSEAQNTRTLTNRRLESRVLANMNGDADVRAANILAEVDADKRQVTLSGTVKSAAIVKRAMDLAKAAQPGVTVVDQLEVQPAELARAEFAQPDASNERQRAEKRGDRIGRSIDDAWIHLEIISRITSGEWAPQGRNIHADVLSGLVTLRGPVANVETKEEIGRTAGDVKGVIKVINNLKAVHS